MLFLRLYKLHSILLDRIKSYFHSLNMASKCCVGVGVKFSLSTSIINQNSINSIVIGDNSLCMGQLLTGISGGSIRIGSWTYLGPNSKIWSTSSITVGDRVQIAHGVSIFDNNSHSLSASDRHQRFRELMDHGKHLKKEDIRSAPIKINDDVWIGFNASIMKGVEIGKGAVIGAAAVIVHNVPPYAIMVGNPARQVGRSTE